ncbi:MAG: TetR family transcriptional regulator [Kordiimonas sp.]
MSASKREELVEKALEVFYQQGFHATGMDKLVAETKISKTSMYKHYKTKEDLILATLKLRDERFRENFMNRATALSNSPKQELIATFDALAEWFEDKKFKSCMFIKASSEYQDPDHPIHMVSAEHKKLLHVYMQRLAEKAELKNPKELASQLQLLQEGAIVLAHLHGCEGVAENAKIAAKALVNAAS